MSLRELDLRDNQLTMIPFQIGQLANLQQILLSKNELTTLPSQVGYLKHLRHLALNDNPWISLPTEIDQLSLAYLNLSENSVAIIPPDVKSQGTMAMLAYLEDYPNLMMRYAIAAIVLVVGAVIALIFGLRRWRQARTGKHKRL